MSAHTPGPWKFALFDHEPNEAFVQWGTGYAAVHGSRAGREANARLIAAAPEMLHELYAAAAQIEALGGDASTQLAVIAKATGAEQGAPT